MSEGNKTSAPIVPHKSDVGIVGGGVAGLNSAIEALKQGYNVNVYEALPYDPDLADNPGKLTTSSRASDLAGAQFYPFGEPSSPDNQVEAEWLRDAVDSYIQRSLVSRYAGTMALRHNVEFMKQPVEMPIHLREILQRFGPVKEFGEIPRNPLEYSYGYDFTTLAINSPAMLNALREEFQELGGNLITRRIRSKDDFFSLPENVLMNCMGMGASTIFPELGLKPVKGDLLFYKNPNGPHGVDTIVSSEDIIMIPRSDNILAVGAGYIKEFDEIEPTEEELGRINAQINQLLSVDIEQLEGLSTKLKQANLVGKTSGFRPVRKQGVLVAAEVGPNDQVVIHNIGHGGSGWTLAGTGKAAVRLIKQAA